MSDGKDRGKQSRDTTDEDGLVTRSGDTDPLLTEREGVTGACDPLPDYRYDTASYHSSH
jgi:hypothetical protein